eukprot:scaffold7066_cov253-Pinguiococcus_pyrenoidosus.AAC.43
MDVLVAQTHQVRSPPSATQAKLRDRELLRARDQEWQVGVARMAPRPRVPDGGAKHLPSRSAFDLPKRLGKQRRGRGIAGRSFLSRRRSSTSSRQRPWSTGPGLGALMCA